MKEMLFAAGLGALAVGTAIAAAPSAADQTFATRMYEANVNEIREARLALATSKNSDITAFAQMMIDDHATANVELAAAARRAGILIPQAAGPPAQDPQLVQLRDAAGKPGFGRAYLIAQGDDHVLVLDMLKQEAASGSSAEMQAYASNMIPILRHHLDMARADLGSLPDAAPKAAGVPGTRGDTGGQINGQSGTQPLSGTPPINPVGSPGPTGSPGPSATGGGGAVPAPTNSPNS